MQKEENAKKLRKERLTELFQKQKKEQEMKEAEKLLKTRPTYKDVQSCFFSQSNEFVENEIVVIPRSRGGFSFGRVHKKAEKKYCIFGGKEYSHPSKLWKVVYLSDTTEGFKKQAKDLPPVWMGKRKKMAGEIVEKDSKEETVGESPSITALRSALVGLNQEFEVGELVVVPEATCGFVVAKIEEKMEEAVCPDEQNEHTLKGWTVSMGEELAEDLCSAQIFKIFNVSSLVPLAKPLSPVEIVPRVEKSEEVSKEPKEGGILKISKNAVSANETKTAKRTNSHNKKVVVVDGPNVARKHGKKDNVSVCGIKLVIDFYEQRGFQVVVFLPEHYANRKPPKQSEQLTLAQFMPMADDLPLLQKLISQEKVFLVPSKDYDDSYAIKYAQIKKGVIVTNDRFNDYLAKNPHKKKWIRTHCISFMFVKNEFIPNPDFVWPSD